jgi:hypothetical protein
MFARQVLKGRRALIHFGTALTFVANSHVRGERRARSRSRVVSTMSQFLAKVDDVPPAPREAPPGFN